jgi:ech hydrogenase subunit C
MKYFRKDSPINNVIDTDSNLDLMSDLKIYISYKDVLNYSYGKMVQNINSKIERNFNRKLRIMKVDNGACNGCNYEISNINKNISEMDKINLDFTHDENKADIFLITGTASRNMDFLEYFNEKLFDKNKKIIAVGIEACEGAVFKDVNEISNSIDSMVFVDIYLSECPPNVKTIVYGIEMILDNYG